MDYKHMQKEDVVIDMLLKFIKQQSGIALQKCEDFSGINTHRGKKYFNALIGQRISESMEFATLERAFKTSDLITSIEPNGFHRIAIFFDLDMAVNLTAHTDHAEGRHDFR